MVNLVGVLLILSSLLSLAAGAFIDLRYGSNAEVTGNVIANIATQPEISIGLMDYIEAIAFSYSILSFIMGVMFLIKM